MPDPPAAVPGPASVSPAEPPEAVPPCPKCASDDVLVRFHRARFMCDPHSRYTNNDQEGEHLHYKCRHCSYDWTGDVADGR